VAAAYVGAGHGFWPLLAQSGLYSLTRCDRRHCLAKPSAEFLGEPDEKPFRSADVA
jgi:hypothetical protein